MDSDDVLIIEKLEDARRAYKLVTSKEFSTVFKTIAESIVERAISEFCTKIDPNKIEDVVRIRETIKFYKYGLFDEIQTLIQVGEIALEEAQERGLKYDLT